MEEDTSKTKKRSKKNWYILMLVVGIILLIVFIVWLLMKGDVKTTGTYPDDTTPESLKCVKKDVAYKFFKSDSPASAEVKINAVFTKGKLDSLSFTHRTAYSDENNARIMSDAHEADMNLSFYDVGMGSYSLNAKYSTDKNIAQMTLFVKPEDLNSTSVKYIMLDSLPENLTGYKRGYTGQGFTCEVVR